MFKLSDGILLENSGKLLRWGSNREAAWKIGHPTRCFADDDTRIKWEENILGGLRCSLIGYLPDDTILNELSITIALLEPNYRSHDALMQYCTLFNHLVQQIGVPSVGAIPKASSMHAPILTWSFNDCILQLVTGERHGDWTDLEISKGKTPRYPTG